MRTFPVSLGLLAVLLLAGGCAAHLHHRAYDPAYYRHRVDDDARRYVRLVDEALRLDRDQERRMARLLQSRAYHLLDRTPVHAHDRVYPFPRDRRHGRAVRVWWRDADRHLARVLTRGQADRYYDLVRDGYFDDAAYARGRRR